MSTTKKRKPTYRLPCPGLEKGRRCPLCGGAYVCLQPERKKIAARSSEGGSA